LPLAVRNNKSVEFEFFPNPANDQLTVNTGTLMAEDAFAEVIDILGQKLIAQKINSTLTTIDISKLVKGIYFINLNYKDVNTANTFIKK
jgi:hypothetical protein